MRVVVLTVLVIGACVRSSLNECVDGSVCPAGLQCVEIAEQQFCVGQDQIEACEDSMGAAIADMTRCTFGNQIEGTCFGGVCLPAGCGNGRLDDNEVCDDGNTVSLDGCSDACTSNETCGNTISDVLMGETCDDGNLQDHDGCSSTCELERASWQIDTLRPQERVGAAMTFHAARRRVVMFGGRLPNTLLLGDTWEWDGVGWRSRPGFAPFERDGHAMVYDPANEVIVLFGGNAEGLSNDTWEWSGAWTVRTPPTAPPSRDGHALVYDGARRRVVMFGGTNPDASPPRADDTWEWDGVNWSEVSPPVRPSSRAGHAMAYDPTRGRIVMFGGQRGAGGGPLPIDTWEYDGTTWTQITPNQPPPTGRFRAAMVFDSARNRVVMVGGTIGAGGEKAEVWEWDGATWENVSVTLGVPGIPTAAFDGPSLTSDPSRGLVLVAGGQTWIRSGSNGAWSLLDPDPGPPARSRLAAALVPERRLVLMFGGTNGALLDDTWLWNGEWKQATTATRPDATAGAGLVYDAARREGVLFGSNSISVNDTWIWRFTSGNDGTWTRIPGTAADPRSRAGHVMVYDPARRETLLYGGRPGVDRLNDTWIWDGTTWSERVGVGPTVGRDGAAAAYDPIRQTIVMFGGAAPMHLADLWEWDGTAWVDITPPISPRARSHAGLAWNPARRRLVMSGGISGQAVLSDTWELVRSPGGEARWELVEPAEALAPRGEHVMVSSIDGRGVSILHGIESVVPVQRRADIITLRWEGARAVEVCTGVDADGDALIGCADVDCWAICTPACEPGTTCDPAAPSCGDGTCSLVEDCATCPEDCSACPAVCGNFTCDESASSCPGDCP